jgi:hypothetical protein
MRDIIEAQMWAEHGERFSEHLHRLFESVGDTFRLLVAIQFAAPWRKASRNL